MRSYSLYIHKAISVLAIVAAFAIVGSAQGGMQLSVDANKEKGFRLPFDLNPGSLKFTVDPEVLASIRFNTNDTFIVKGLTPGEGTVVVSGTRNTIDAAGKVRAQPFRQNVLVRVLPRRDVDTLTRPISVGKGSDAAKVLTVGYLMSPGQEFANINAEGINWRQLFYVGGNSSVARGELFDEGNVKKFRITGISDGKTTLKLLGERRVANTWQSVERILTITVGTGRPPKPNVGNENGNAVDEPANEDPANLDGRNKIVEAIERSFANTKQLIDRPGYDDNEAARLLTELDALIALIDQEMSKEENIDSFGSRWLKLQKVKNAAELERRSLKDRLNKKPKPVENTPLAGKWRLEINGQKQPGEFTFRESPATALLYKDSKMWLLVLAPGSQNRTVAIPAQAEVRMGFSMQLIQLRGDAASGRLEFWATPDQMSAVFQNSGYVLIRDKQ